LIKGALNMKFLVINGPNLNLLGRREPGIYGNETYTQLCELIQNYALEHSSLARCFQSNHEGAIIDEIHAADGVYDAIIINPGAYTHYSYAILDALKAVSVPAYEVHISHIDQREPFRAISVTAPACVGQLYGLGFQGYLRAMDYFLEGQSPARLCVIGDPVAHSLSPKIQTAMLDALGVRGTYTAQHVKPEELEQFLSRVRAGEFTGFNATMPHKQALVNLVDKLDESAEVCQAVNTVCVENGQLVGYNTDGAGFVSALGALGCNLSGKTVAMLGAGGAARSVGYALAKAGAKQVIVCARNQEKAADLCGMNEDVLVPSGFDLDSLTRAAESAQVLVNCTNLGMDGQGQFQDFSFLDGLRENAVVCDLIYHPAETELLRLARIRRHMTMNGLPMLVWQGVLALEKFLGRGKLDRSTMSAAAYRSLGDPGLYEGHSTAVRLI
jgi:3-dehydroquinate dehydratase type II